MLQNTVLLRMIRLWGIVFLVLTLSGCQTAYFSALEKFGIEKREILVSRVNDAKQAQQQAQKRFSSALEEFSHLIDFKGGELQHTYDNINQQYKASEEAASKVTDRVNKVTTVAEALFEEWQHELTLYSNTTLKQKSQLKLQQTKLRYIELIKSMHNVEQKMAPVLNLLRDNVLYLKHNLNASAIGSLQSELSNIKVEVRILLKEMNDAIETSDEFVRSIQE